MRTCLSRALWLCIASLLTTLISVGPARADDVIPNAADDVLCNCWAQVGVYPDGDANVDTVRTYMGEPAYMHKGSTIQNFYWLGVVFPNGYFYQAGYEDRSDSCSNGFETFTTRLNAHGHFVDPDDPYDPTHCGLSGSHTFKLAISSTTESTVTWQFYMDGDAIGSSIAFPNTAGNVHFPKNSAATVAEAASTTALPDDPPFPNEHFINAIQTYSGGSWSDVPNGDYTSRDQNCSYRGLQKNGANDVTAGRWDNLSTPGCYGGGAAVW